ncbi:MAG: RagB/SusD family nutrient uptake outer membrane protein [Saprospiraceae bacterium]|nr:RagB/SusD family nutrient uptake outer membrane protein [Saprospiraceae bacterium]
MKHSKLFIIVFVGLIFTACEDFLNPNPDFAVSQEEFFSSDAEIVAGIIGIYDSIQGISEEDEGNWTTENRGIQYEFLLTEHRSDNSRSLSNNERQEYHRYEVEVGDIYSEDYYASMYEVIYRANNILQFMEVADPGNIPAYTAEARFLRAYAYFNLVRLYGAVPLVTNTLNPGDEAAYVRADVNAIYTQITNDLMDAVANLPDGTKGRASKAAAEALLAKVYLSQPSPNYLGAQQLLESVMNPARGFMLMPDFSDVFYSELNDEVIFAIEYENDVFGQCQIYSAEFDHLAGREDGLNFLEQNLIDAFDANGGDRTAVSYLSEDQGLFCAKFVPSSATTRCAGNDWIVLRYADVLLMHAESILAGAQSTTSINALNSVNEVRNRAGLADITGTLTAEDLLLERRVELAFENQRFYDLQRFGVATTVLGDYSSNNGYSFNVNQMLLPIPPREIQQSAGLMAQNPGY